MRTMQDAVNTLNFTDAADIYASYVFSDTGQGYNNYAATVKRFPNKRHLSICTRFNATADILDYETITTGTGRAADAVAWTQRMRAAGRTGPHTPWNYCNESTWPELRAAYRAAGVAEPLWWIANTSKAPGALFAAGAHAHQYSFNLPANRYDSSVCLDFIPGFDSGAAPAGGGTQIGVDDVSAADVFAFVVKVPQLGPTVQDTFGSLVATNRAMVGSVAQQVAAVAAQVTALQGALSANQAAVLGAIATINDDTPITDAQVAALAESLKADLAPEIVKALGTSLLNG